MKNAKAINNLHTLLLVLCCLTFIIAFTGYSITGSHMRLSGDDYCYDAALTQSGFWKTQWDSYFQIQNYSGNRYALTFFSSLIGLFGPKANAVLPGAALALWIIGTLWSMRAVSSKVLPRSFLQISFITGTIIFFTLSLAPDLEQSLYWRSAMLPYLFPIILDTILIGCILRSRGDSRTRISRSLLSFLLAFLAGGLSETGAALQAGCLTIWLIFLFLRRRTANQWHDLYMAIGSAWIGTGIAIALLILSPTNTVRQTLLGLPDPPNLPTLIHYSIRYSYTFLHSTIKLSFLPHLLMFLSSLLFAWLTSFEDKTVDREVDLNPFLQLALLPFAAFALIMCVVAPSAWAQSDYPVARAMILARWITVLSSVAGGWMAGAILKQRAHTRRRRQDRWTLVSSFLLIAILMFPWMEVKDIFSDLWRYQRWSSAWDARDQQIRKARSEGVVEVNVMELDHIIPDVAELRPDPDFWYNNCAELYYDVRSISADQPGWDD
jgi:hypothetical protein